MARPARQPTKAEIYFVSLKNCLVNLPQSLVNTIAAINAPAQNVVVEILTNDGAISKAGGKAVLHSIYVGWSGFPSTQKSVYPASYGHEQGFANVGTERATVDIDATFGCMLGLAEGHKVGVLLHLDPPLAHAVNIEPLTPGDWEVIELHANFLELNLLSQIRVLPNPSYSSSVSSQMQHSHPLTLHLSPTSTANIIVTSLVPPLSSSQPFAKIAADAEVIVAPKARPRLSERNGSRSVASMGSKSASGRSSSRRVERPEKNLSGKRLLLRPCDRRYCDEQFHGENDEMQKNAGLKIWVDPDTIADSALRNLTHVLVSIVRPTGIEKVLDPQQQQKRKVPEPSDTAKPASSIVAKLIPWYNAPGASHAALSSPLCFALNAPGIVGGIAHVQTTPRPLGNRAAKGVVVHPFLADDGRKNNLLRFGGHLQSGRDDAFAILRQVLDSPGPPTSHMDEPLTSGLLISSLDDGLLQSRWRGGMLRFTYGSGADEESEQTSIAWMNGLDADATVDFGSEMVNPHQTLAGHDLPDRTATMVGAESLIDQLYSQILRSSSILLTGRLGSGKTSLVRSLGIQLRLRKQFHVSYLPCRTFTIDEVRIASVKESMERLFSAASWAVRLGGQSVVVLDDLDKLCPVVTELQTPDTNRSNQISELVSRVVRTYCESNSDIVLLATAQSQDSLNSLLVGVNLFKNIITLKAPNKDQRRMLLQAMIGDSSVHEENLHGANRGSLKPHNVNQAGWMNDSLPPSPATSSKYALTPYGGLDILDIVRQTDGYMPADLGLLVSRAKSEALIRSVASDHDGSFDADMLIRKQDFDRAFMGFTPASLRNVTLQLSNITFESIGGLKSTRKTLLETLQYPTLYAPIFANCPLRLRSGLLLYGYPGCGKTLLASAVAGECGLNFISVKGPEILNKYIGASEKSVRDLFERAESARPCVLFFDEFDSIAPKRGHDSTGVTDRVVNQLLTQMDGAEGLSGVYVLAATSRPDLIDPALLRPGRLDKSILCDLPGSEDRLDILTVISKKLRIDPRILSSHWQGLYEVAQRTGGYSGADLQAVVYNAHLEAIHDELRGHDGANEASKTTYGAKPAPPSTKLDILRFPFGKEADSEARSTSVNRAKEVADYHKVIAKLEELKRLRRSESRQGQEPALQGDGNRQHAGKGGQEVVIQWKHIEASLACTRSSISPQERERLKRFYREFTVGRNGELPNGEGSTEVGGRTSLI
ncbi:MAG: hypothetical protein L6R39_001436 [Caloplaca ligustica]|nr:MAG: hypothetical protein L6R39_001436 [Caloplaca ligustica]